jgi:hypothetical protein
MNNIAVWVIVLFTCSLLWLAIGSCATISSFLCFSVPYLFIKPCAVKSTFEMLQTYSTLLHEV